MTTPHTQEPHPIRRALLSVSDKAGLVEFAQVLRGFDVELISTGGTARMLREASIAVRDVSDVTEFPEMLDGRVKTLHPRIHGGILAMQDETDHMAALREHGIEPIDMVVVNLYPFEQTIARPGATIEDAVEQIDIGGPAMIRSAAKNWRDVAVVVSPVTYTELVAEMIRTEGKLSLTTRWRLAQEAFARTSAYDRAIYDYLSARQAEEAINSQAEEVNAADAAQISASSGMPSFCQLALTKKADLRYGENPHQRAALYQLSHDQSDGTDRAGSVATAELISGKEMSFNNYLDADAAWQLVCEFDETACVITKHTNPAGVGLGALPEAAYRRALATDSVSAFGGIVAFNRTLDEATAQAVTEIFTEVIVAPDYHQNAIEILRAKKNLRILQTGALLRIPDSQLDYDFKKISGGILVQTIDNHRLMRDALKVVTKRAPSDEEVTSLLFAWTVCKHTKSNAIVYARHGQTVGVGAGQMSRVDSVRIGAMRAQLPLQGSVLASDAFFPFRDGVDEAARHGITAIIQPGGSVRDSEVIASADEHGLAMVFTNVRHFKH